MTPDQRQDIAKLLTRITRYVFGYSANSDCIIIEATQDDILSFRTNYKLRDDDLDDTLYECANPKRKAIRVNDCFALYLIWSWIRDTEGNLLEAKELCNKIDANNKREL